MLMTEDEAKREPCPFDIGSTEHGEQPAHPMQHKTACRASACRIGWRWAPPPTGVMTRKKGTDGPWDECPSDPGPPQREVDRCCPAQGEKEKAEEVRSDVTIQDGSDDAVVEFYRKHRGGSGCVILVIAVNGDDLEYGIFGTIEAAEEWSDSLPEDRACIFSPYIVDDPAWGDRVTQ